MEKFTFSLYEFSIVKFLFIALVLFIILRLLNRVVIIIPVKKTIHQYFLRLLPVVEISIWVLFLFWAFDNIFKGNLYYTIITSLVLFIILGLFSWFAARDFIAGIILRAENAFELNQLLEINEKRGLLKKIGYRTLELEIQNGEIMKIPYTKIASEILIKADRTDSAKSQKLKFTTESDISPYELAEEIKKYLLFSPLVILKRDPEIKLVDQNENKYSFEITLSLLNSEFTPLIEQELNEKFN